MKEKSDNKTTTKESRSDKVYNEYLKVANEILKQYKAIKNKY